MFPFPSKRVLVFSHLVFWSSQEWAERVEQQMTRFMDFLREKGAPRWMTWRMGAEVRPGWLEHVQHEDG